MSDTEPELTSIPEEYDDDDYMAFVIDIKLKLQKYVKHEGLPMLHHFNNDEWVKLLKNLK